MKPDIALAERLELAAKIAREGLEFEMTPAGKDQWVTVINDPITAYTEADDWHGFELRIKEEPETIVVPLGPKDVPPGSVICGSGEIGYEGWCLITSCSLTGIRIWRHGASQQEEYTWKELQGSGSQLLRPGGQWEPFEKTIVLPPRPRH